MVQLNVLFALILLFLSFFSTNGYGQSSRATFNTVDIPTGTKISINQVETTEFPKVKLYTSVTRSGLPLGGLTPKNFRVRENNLDQAPIKISVVRDSIAAVILLDVSGSMKGAIADTKTAAIGFLKTLNPGDRVQVITFHEQIDTIYALGEDFQAAERAINGIRHRGDTALYDGVHAAVAALQNVPGRRAVIVLSDGVDDDGYGKQLSKRDLDEPLLLGIQTNIPIYTVGLGSKMDAGILKTFAGTTGAEYVNAPTKSQLEDLYAKIGQQLSSQYAIEYTSTRPLEGGLREVKLDFVVPSRKPYAAPEAVRDDAGRVISYKAPVLNEDEIGRLARMAGVDDYAINNKIKPLEKFIQEVPNNWPSGIPVYENAGAIKVEDKDNTRSFSFDAQQKPDVFIDQYNQVLTEDEWSIFSRTKAGNMAFVKAYKDQSEMTIGILGNENSSKISIEYNIPTDEPIVIDKNNANQIIAADGRDVIVAGHDGVIIISGGCGKLTLSGGSNQVQCDSVKLVDIVGDSNVIILGSVVSGTISGNKNELAWGSGVDGADPTIKSTGDANKITRLD